MADISIIGAGSWGTALAVLLHKNGHKITVWSIMEPEIEMLQREHEHKDKLPGVKLPEDMAFTTDLEAAVKDKDVLVVEDIVDSGRTLSYLLEMLKDRGPKSVKLCTLLDKPERRVVDVHVDYTCFQIPDEFVVGYGLDYDQRYRNLPYIGVVEFD